MPDFRVGDRVVIKSAHAHYLGGQMGVIRNSPGKVFNGWGVTLDNGPTVGVREEYLALVPSRCTSPCWTPLQCPSCYRTMPPRGRSVPLGTECGHDDCPARDSHVNPRHLWSDHDDERWRFYPDEAPKKDEDE